MLRSTTCLLVLASLTLAGPALADKSKSRKAPRYEVTITNLTKGQTFTPILLATHGGGVSIFEPGAAASHELELLAEAGDTGPLSDSLRARGNEVGHVETLPDLLGPGETRKVVIRAASYRRHITLAAMLIPTNDTFFALEDLALPVYGSTVAHALAWDAGTEANDQDCLNIPGPVCGGEGYSADPGDGDEGHVHVSNGFHDQGPDRLAPFGYDWRNPVARIRVRRLY